MATALKRLPGIALVLLSGTDEILAWEKISTDAELKFATPSAANAPYTQKVATKKDYKGQLSGFMGSEFPTFHVGDEMEVLHVKEGTNEVSATMLETATFGIVRITHVKEEFGEDPAKNTVDFEWGFIDGPPEVTP